MIVRTITAGALALVAGTAAAQVTGPSSSQSPYVLPATGPNAAAPGDVQTVSIFTVGDTIGGYRMVGIPDGLGAFGNGDGTMTVLMNHELGATSGIARAHGQTGAFVSRWNINTGNLLVNSGRDHNTSAADVSIVNGAAQFNRFCSADLAPQSAYQFGSLGTSSRIFMNGEEAGNEGRAFAHIASGAEMNRTYQLPRLGKFSWENSVASPFAQQKTIVMGTDDTTPGQVYMYVGNKTDSGNDIERAGLTNGNLYGVRVAGTLDETRAAGAVGRFDMFNKGDVSNLTGAQIQANSEANNVTEFLRPEDGAWDTRAGHENDFYFVTTDRFNSATQQGNTRLYRMRFDDITNPEAGGEISLLLDGRTAGPQMMDNICIDSFGRILIQEDIGANDNIGKIWLFDTASQNLALIAEHDTSRFAPGAAGFLTRDEESSGIIDAKDMLGEGWFLLDVQAHYGISGELVEGGQLLAMYVDPAVIPAPATFGLVGLAGVFAGRRRR